MIEADDQVYVIFFFKIKSAQHPATLLWNVKDPLISCIETTLFLEECTCNKSLTKQLAKNNGEIHDKENWSPVNWNVGLKPTWPPPCLWSIFFPTPIYGFGWRLINECNCGPDHLLNFLNSTYYKSIWKSKVMILVYYLSTNFDAKIE